MSLKFPQQYYDNLTTKHKDDIITRYKNGESIRQIANKYKVRSDAIKRRLQKWKIPLRDRHTINDQILESKKWEILSEYMRGTSINRIAARMKRDAVNIAKKIREWGYFDLNTQNRIKNYRKYHMQKELYNKRKNK
jgi:predicted DNA-binding protein YlxM (UPF0122 family)